MRREYDVGVVVGRFQVDELTKAHLDIIEQVSSTHKRIVIMVGVSPTLVTRSNPLDYLTRKEMLSAAFPNAIISHIGDVRNDKDWSNTLDSSLRYIIPMGSICLYGGRDSFIRSYAGIFDTHEIPSLHYEEAGTHTRDDIRTQVGNSAEFRRGVIYASQNQYPKAYPTVDVALTRSAVGGCKEVLLGRKEASSNKYSFIGGFVDPTDVSYEVAAIREASEEIDITIDDSLSYISSRAIDDWRYKTNEKIITTFYEARVTFGEGEPKEEFYDTKWFIVNAKLIDVITKTHLPLVNDLLTYYDNKKER